MGHEERHSSESNEWYTPPHVVQAFRSAFGGKIDFDPASCDLANTIVQANDYCTSADNGLSCAWNGNVFLNPPGGHIDADGRRVLHATKKRKPCSETGACGLPVGHKHVGVTASARRWWIEAASRWASGEINQLGFVAFSIELLQTTQVNLPKGCPHPLDGFVCIPRTRIDYLVERNGVLVEGGSPTHSSALIYLGDREFPIDSHDRFVAAFGGLGRLVTAL